MTTSGRASYFLPPLQTFPKEPRASGRAVGVKRVARDKAGFVPTLAAIERLADITGARIERQQRPARRQRRPFQSPHHLPSKTASSDGWMHKDLLDLGTVRLIFRAGQF